VIAEFAKGRGSPFINLYDKLPIYVAMPRDESRAPVRLTDNGLHLTDEGYRQAAFVIASELKLPVAGWSGTLSAKGEVVAAEGVQFTEVSAAGDRLTFTIAAAAGALFPNISREEAKLKITGLDPQTSYKLSISGGSFITATGREWEAGLVLPRRDHDDALRQLRETITAKNELYFHRWRPQNVTYLFGFRKHEQGNNAVEIPMFDPLIEKQEAEIAKLRRVAIQEAELAPVK